MRARKRLATSLALALFGAAALEAGRQDRLPDWAARAMEQKGAYERFEGKNYGLVLHDFGSVDYDGRGGVTKVRQSAFHIRTRDARDWGVVRIPLTGKSDRLTNFMAWIVYPNGRTESFNKRDLAEVATNMDALYSEKTMMILDRSDSVRNDSVFVFEYEIRSKSDFMESFWMFQNPLPTVYSAFEVEVPDGWEVMAHALNGVEPKVFQRSGSTLWEAIDLASLKDEPNRPALFAMAGMMGISVVPDARSEQRYGLQAFRDWQALAGFAFQSQIEAIAPNSAVAAKAKELCSGKETAWEKVKAICEYAQSVNYLSVDMNLAKGGGYVPRSADFVLEKHYGDCKDMTALARSLLESVGIRSYAVVASIGGEEYVHDEWASPAQFNHCILAVEAPTGSESPAVVEHPDLGRLLIFDPTRKDTPFGYLPGSLQGRKVVVGSEESDALVKLPSAQPEWNRTERQATVSIDEEGTMSGEVVEVSFGEAAAYMRHLSRSLSEEDFRKMLQSWIARGTREARVWDVSWEDRTEEHAFRLELRFAARFYTRLLGEDKFMFNPVFLSRREWVPPTDEERTADYVFTPWMLEETIMVTLPDGFAVESMREPMEDSRAYADYVFEPRVEPGGLTIERSLVSRDYRASLADYPQVVDFFEGVTRAESAPVVAARKGPGG